METKKVDIGKKVFEVHELLASEFDEIQKIEDSVDRIVKIVKTSANMSDEDYSSLTLKEREKILGFINELNGWADFQKPVKTQEE